MDSLRVASCQLGTVVGDFDGVVGRVHDTSADLDRLGCDIAVFPAGLIGGSPLADLGRDRGFLAAHDEALAAVAATARGRVVYIGGVTALGPAVFVCIDGGVAAVVHGHDDAVGEVAGVRVGVAVGLDAFAGTAVSDVGLWVVPDAAEFRPGRHGERRRTLGARATSTGSAVAYVNRVGGHDGLVFDGGSVLVASDGRVVAAARRFEPDVVVADVPVARVSPNPAGSSATDPGAERGHRSPLGASAPEVTIGREAEIWRALVAGLGAYVTDNGFTDVVLGLSGGVDSALVATLASEALGSGHVHAVSMPSRYSSGHSRSDAEELAANLGIELRVIPIEPAHRAFGDMLAGASVGLDGGVTEQNIQARARGVVVMALSNAFGWLALSCGNKSEAAVGYSTLYGDTAGGLQPIGDVFKTDVYALCRWWNRSRGTAVIPESILTKAPSAELRPGQRDDQSLPPYDLLDPILRDHVERGLGIDELVAGGHRDEVVRQVVALVTRAEYKRRQEPPVIVVTDRAFIEDRRFPMTNAFGV